MDRPDLEGVFDLRGYTSQVLHHPTEENIDEVIFYTDGTVPVGSLTFRYVDDEVIFLTMNITESHQNNGIMTAIIAETTKVFRKAGFKTWAIENVDEGPLSEMYEKCGFQREGGRLEAKIGNVGKLEKTAQARLKKGGMKP